MGRHSIPDPDESAGDEEPEDLRSLRPSGSATREPTSPTAGQRTASTEYSDRYPDARLRPNRITSGPATANRPTANPSTANSMTTSRNTTSPTRTNPTIQCRAQCGLGSAAANAIALRAAARR